MRAAKSTSQIRDWPNMCERVIAKIIAYVHIPSTVDYANTCIIIRIAVGEKSVHPLDIMQQGLYV